MRRADWRARLAAYVEQSRRTAFEPGRFDCALFVAGAVEAMTGEDHAEGIRGAYSSLGAGKAAVRALGYIDHVDMARAKFNLVRDDRGRPAPHLAQAGDIAVLDTPDGEALGLVQGARILVAAPRGIASVDLLAAKAALRV